MFVFSSFCVWVLRGEEARQGGEAAHEGATRGGGSAASCSRHWLAERLVTLCSSSTRKRKKKRKKRLPRVSSFPRSVSACCLRSTRKSSPSGPVSIFFLVPQWIHTHASVYADVWYDFTHFSALCASCIRQSLVCDVSPEEHMPVWFHKEMTDVFSAGGSTVDTRPCVSLRWLGFEFHTLPTWTWTPCPLLSGSHLYVSWCWVHDLDSMGDDFPYASVFRIYVVRQWIHARVSCGCLLDEFPTCFTWRGTSDPEVDFLFVVSLEEYKKLYSHWETMSGKFSIFLAYAWFDRGFNFMHQFTEAGDFHTFSS